MRMFMVVLVAFNLCSFSVMGEGGPNQFPALKQDTFSIKMTFFKGNPKGSIEKGDVKETDSSSMQTSKDGGASVSIGMFDGALMKIVENVSVYVKVLESAEKTLEVEVKTILDELGEGISGPNVSKNERTQQIQLGGTIRIRMSPENDECERWVEIKIEKVK